MTISETTDTSAPHFFYEIIGFEEVPVQAVIPHPHNPRPKFHLRDDDPGLLALGDSIKTEGQFEPALVFEQVGHYSLPDAPGTYILLKGERRWRACGLVGQPTLRTLVCKTPTNQAEEEMLLGIEDSFKEPWGRFFVMRFAVRLAALLDLPVVDREIAAKTGLRLDDLRQAERIFQLEPAIQALVAEYEEQMYQQRISGARKAGGRLSRSRVTIKEFTVPKAAMVWDIFHTLRSYYPVIVKDYSDLELQRRIAQLATASSSSYRKLEAILGLLRRHADRETPPGLLSQIAEMLSGTKTVTHVLEQSGSKDALGFQRALAQLHSSIRKIDSFQERIAHVGDDLSTLKDAQRLLLDAYRTITEMERALSRRVAELEV